MRTKRLFMKKIYYIYITMTHLNLEKLMVLDKHHLTSKWTYFLKR